MYMHTQWKGGFSGKIQGILTKCKGTKCNWTSSPDSPKLRSFSVADYIFPKWPQQYFLSPMLFLNFPTPTPKVRIYDPFPWNCVGLCNSTNRGPWWKGARWLAKQSYARKGDTASTCFSLLECASITLSSPCKKSSCPKAAICERPLGKATWMSKKLNLFQLPVVWVFPSQEPDLWVWKLSWWFQGYCPTTTTRETPSSTTKLTPEL